MQVGYFTLVDKPRRLMENFGNTATKLSRNPLGIIALFIVLVYGIAGLVLGVSGESLVESHKTVLVSGVPGTSMISFVNGKAEVSHNHQARSNYTATPGD